MREVRDPEFDTDDEPQTPGVCRKGLCDGSGWMQVTEGYVDRVAPMPVLPDPLDDLEASLYEAMNGEALHLRAAHRNSSYPCSSCQPIQFGRWYGGHWASRHNRENCADCWLIDFPNRGARRTRRKDTTRDDDPGPTYTEPTPPPERMDLA